MTQLSSANYSSVALPDISPSSKRFAGKRVAMVTFSQYPNDARPRRAVSALVNEGATVDLICLGGENQPGRESFECVNVLRVPLKHVRRGKFDYALRYGGFIFLSSVIFALRTIIRRYHLIYIHNMPDILVASALVPKALGAKVVLDLHDPMPELMTSIFRAAPDAKIVRLLKGFEKWSIARADLVVTVNIACQRIFSNRSCSSEKILVVMNSPDNRIFPYRATKESDYGYQTEIKPFVLMYHGSLVERNGLEVAIDALDLVRKSIPNAVLHVFGAKTDFLDRMMNKVREKNLTNAVWYFGPKRLEELVVEIDKCDLGVIPNHRNPFTEINTPTRIFEYLALGKPVIAPSTAGIVDYFKNDSLLFFEAGNSEDLARRIAYAFTHSKEMLEITRAGQQVYREHTWDREREGLIDRISALFDRKPEMQRRGRG